MEVGQVVLIVAHHAHLVDRSECSEELLEIFLMDVLLRQSVDFETVLFGFDIFLVIFLGTDGAEEMYFPEKIEDEDGKVAECGSQTNDIGVILLTKEGA